MTSTRNNVTAGVLAIVLGAFGVHKFYNGSYGYGIVFAISNFILPGFSAACGLVEGIIYLTDKAKYDATYANAEPQPWRW